MEVNLLLSEKNLITESAISFCLFFSFFLGMSNDLIDILFESTSDNPDFFWKFIQLFVVDSTSNPNLKELFQFQNPNLCPVARLDEIASKLNFHDQELLNWRSLLLVQKDLIAKHLNNN